MLRLKKSFFIWKMYLNGFIAIKHKIAEFGAIWRKIKINYYISRLCWDKKKFFFIWKMYLKMALLRWKKNWGIWSNLTCRPRSSAGIFSALSSFVAETPTMFLKLSLQQCRDNAMSNFNAMLGVKIHRYSNSYLRLPILIV